MVDAAFWRNKRVFVTGHTGFKGSWLTVWLQSMGAKVTGYALAAPTKPSLFELAKVEETMEKSHMGDIRDLTALVDAIHDAQPEIVFHMAAQPLVRDSYKMPVETYSVNVMGTVNILEAVRQVNSVRAVINITTDKCYENNEWHWGYREIDTLGGFDPYSNSKACSELVTGAYRSSFFNPSLYHVHGVAVATARAGNVIGGGDWASDRLIPDCFRAIIDSKPVIIRNPDSIRPWQHVLEPLSGYLLLAEKLCSSKGISYGEAWNFGPADHDVQPVKWIVEKICSSWGNGASYEIQVPDHQFHEATYLKLDCSKAIYQLDWKPRWTLENTIQKIVEWNLRYVHNTESVMDITLQQIKEFASKGAV